MDFSSPQFDSAKSMYRIMIISEEVLESEPFYLDISGQPTITEPDVSEFVSLFVKDFIKKDAEAKWFASRLKEASIVKKLKHSFTLDDASLPSENGWYTAYWRPHSLEIYSTGFQLCWDVKEYTSAPAQISSRFIAFSEPPTPRPESPNDEQEELRQLTIHTTNDLVPLYDIPYATENTAIDFEKQEHDKRVLQEARLRLALAKLKSERLIEKYYRKYGEVPEDEFSDLSEDEGPDSP